MFPDSPEGDFENGGVVVAARPACPDRADTDSAYNWEAALLRNESSVRHRHHRLCEQRNGGAPLSEDRTRCLKRRGGVRLAKSNVGCNPFHTVHPLERNEMATGIDDRYCKSKAATLCLGTGGRDE